MASRGASKKSATVKAKPKPKAKPHAKPKAKPKAPVKARAASKSTAPAKSKAKPAAASKAKGTAKRPSAANVKAVERPAREAAVVRPTRSVEPEAAPKRPAGSSRRGAVAPVRREPDPRYRHLGERLVAKQRELLQAYAVSKGDSRDRFDDGTEDYIDYAVNSYAKDFVLSLNEIERKQLLLVQDALRRLNRGEYGRCLQCDEEIPIRRLEVVPWVRYCVRCQELEDRGELEARPSADNVEAIDEDGELVEDEFEEEIEEEEDDTVEADEAEEEDDEDADVEAGAGADLDAEE